MQRRPIKRFPGVRVPAGMHVRLRDFDEILGIEFVSLTGSLLAGFLLALIIGDLRLLPGLLVLLPGFLEMSGDISGSLAARLSSGLFLRAVEPRWSFRQSYLRGNLAAALALGLFVSCALGIVAWAVTLLLGGLNQPVLIAVALLAGLLANIVEIPLTVAGVFWLFKRGHDPNNVIGPLVTTMGDVVSIVALAVALAVLL